MISNRATTNAIIFTMASGAIRASRRDGDATTLLGIALDGIPALTGLEKRYGFWAVTGDRAADAPIADKIEQKIADAGLPHGIDAVVRDRLANAFDVAARRLANDDRPLPKDDDARIRLQEAAQTAANAIAATHDDR